LWIHCTTVKKKKAVEDMLVAHSEDYMFSSACNYADLDFLLEVIMEPQQLITVR